MFKKIVFTLLFGLSLLQARNITPNDVFSEVVLIKKYVRYLSEYYSIEINVDGIEKRTKVRADLKPRNVWQKAYEILVEINILRNKHGLPTIVPVNMSPVLNLNPDLVYEQTQRIQTELKVFFYRNDIEIPKFQKEVFVNKNPIDVFNGLSVISEMMDTLNGSKFTPSYVFAENMRIYDDITNILNRLGIKDNTIPAKKKKNATPNDAFSAAMKVLDKIRQLQVDVGIVYVDFSSFKKDKQTPSEVFGITQMIIAELQTIKAYLGINDITPPAKKYILKTPSEVEQLISWNLRKLNLITSLNDIRR